MFMKVYCPENISDYAVYHLGFIRLKVKNELHVCVFLLNNEILFFSKLALFVNSIYTYSTLPSYSAYEDQIAQFLGAQQPDTSTCDLIIVVKVLCRAINTF